MKNSYDIILYFGWVHSSCIHKYFSLEKELNKQCNTLLILGNSGSAFCPNYGITQDQFSMFKDISENVIVANMEQATSIMLQQKPKILVFGGEKWSQDWQRNVGRSLPKTTTIQLPHGVFGEVWEKAQPDYLATLGPIHKLFLKANKPAFKDTKKMLINPWLQELNEDCLPKKIDRQAFCAKYNLKPDKDIFIWLPDMLLVSGGKELDPRYGVTREELLEIYKEVCSIENTIIKLHPSEYKRHKANRIQNQWSYELAGTSAPVLDPIDSHWAYKYCASGITHTSSIGLEFGFLRRPVVHIAAGAASHWDPEWKIEGKSYYSWVGHECPQDKITEFFLEKKYKIEDSSLYDKHKEKFCVDPQANSIELLSKKITSVELIRK